ncbi:MAG: hypothetical protein M3O70_25415 [Actinomycetota bacterium]|nr:hypothetical protein [Actinomycetota bacterium]
MSRRPWLQLIVIVAVVVVLGFIAQMFLGIDVARGIRLAIDNDLGWILLVVVAFALGRWSARPPRAPRRVDERDRVRT